MPNFQPAFDRVDELVEACRVQEGVPGFGLALTDSAGLLHESAHGYADLAAKTPLTPEHLFKWGSIGKSFTAILLLQLHETGEIDLHAPVTEYLPWFEVQSEFEPITVHHLLSHTAGITRGTDFSPDPAYEVLALRETRAVHPPGRHYHYSNVGYKALGLLLERVTGRDYAAVAREQVLEPLGMTRSEAVITTDLRARMAVGYRGLYDDRPTRPEHPRVPATWLEINGGDGCIVSPPTDLAIYLRMLMNRGEGPHGRILSEESFELMTTAYSEPTPGHGYGYGIGIDQIDGRLHISHAGGMASGYFALMVADLNSGLGVVTMINSWMDQKPIAHYALRALRAAAGGDALPEPPSELHQRDRADLAHYTGTYASENGELRFTVQGDHIALEHDDGPVILEAAGSDAFAANHPDFDLFLFRFGRDDEGRVVEVFHGADWYAGEGYTGPTSFDYPPAWDAYTGHYRSHNPWASNGRVVLRKGRLLLVFPDGDEAPLTPQDDGTFRVGHPHTSPEFILFDSIVDGRALRANLSGCDYYRFFTP